MITIVIYSVWEQATQKGATNSGMCYADMDESHRWVPIVVRAVASFNETRRLYNSISI